MIKQIEQIIHIVRTMSNHTLQYTKRIYVYTVLAIFFISITMFEVKLVYNPEPYSLTLKESITYCATVELFLRGIHCAQCSASRLAFDTDRDRMLALLILSDSTSFTPVAV